MVPRIGRCGRWRPCKNLIARIWKEADLKLHRLERYMASNDPQLEEKRQQSSVCTEPATKRSRILCG